MNLEESFLPGTIAKAQQYALRILNGEDPSVVFEGVGGSLRTLTEELVDRYNQEKEAKKLEQENEGLDQLSQYQKVLSEDLVKKREQNDAEKVKELQIELRSALQEGGPLSKEEIGRRKKLSGWTASYELAAIAEKEGIDLSKLSREEYAQYAIDQYLAIDDDQLRVQPWQRNEQSVEAIVKKARERRTAIEPDTEKAFASFSYQMMELAKKEQKDRYIKDGIRILSGTKDSNSWLFFSVNNGTNQNEIDTYKSYFSLKDLNQFSPEQFVSFMEELQKRGYNGGVKIFQDLTEQGTRLNDQVVMHGFSEADAKMAIEVAKEFFGGNIEDTSVGKDEIIEGKSKSYSQILAEKIKQKINN